MKKLILVAAAVLFSVGLGLSAAVAADAPAGPIQVTNYGKKGVVTFEHAKHKEVKCEQCHHKGMDKPKCGECHKAADEGGVPKLQDAAHATDKGACWSCHRAKDAVKKLSCNGCHK
jgi:hypothetical protein